MKNQSTEETYNKKLDADWKIFSNIIEKEVQPFHEEISGKYHPQTYAFYGLDDQQRNVGLTHRTHQSVHWEGELHLDVSEGYGHSPAIAVEQPLAQDEIMGYRTVHTDLTPEEKAFSVEMYDGSAYPQWQKFVGQRYHLQEATENGDGTVQNAPVLLPIGILNPA